MFDGSCVRILNFTLSQKSKFRAQKKRACAKLIHAKLRLIFHLLKNMFLFSSVGFQGNRFRYWKYLHSFSGDFRKWRLVFDNSELLWPVLGSRWISGLVPSPLQVVQSEPTGSDRI